MHKELDTLRKNLARLEAFAAKYPVGDMLVCVHSIPSDKSEPMLGFYVEGSRSKPLAFFGALFGSEGWEREPDNLGFFTYVKTVDGIKVRIYQAERTAPVFGKAAPVPAYIMNGHDGGIELIPDEIRDVEPIGCA